MHSFETLTILIISQSSFDSLITKARSKKSIKLNLFFEMITAKFAICCIDVLENYTSDQALLKDAFEIYCKNYSEEEINYLEIFESKLYLFTARLAEIIKIRIDLLIKLEKSLHGIFSYEFFLNKIFCNLLLKIYIIVPIDHMFCVNHC